MGHTLQAKELPDYLKIYITKQNPALYTPIDHASWRFILKLSQSFFAKHAHEKYLKGLKETGISTERIPLIEEMDACLRKFNWRAVAVSGFIPPGVFMEFLSLGVLPIACDMRKLEHLAYTPAPDIVHEAAGHAPIIADPEYASYLRSYGEISRKAIFSSQDMAVYQAIRYLSDTKEDPRSSAEHIRAAQRHLDDAIASVTYDSEAALLSRMAWWTFEYGLVGSLDHPKIYGAGLLSSMSESYHCFDSTVKKIPFSMECTQMSYDITRPQPQLYVASDFQTLKKTLDELANTMAFRRGGIEGLEKAKQAKTVTTVQLDSGVQVTGVVKEFHIDASGRPDFIVWRGPSQISYQDEQIPGQGPVYHREGYSSPIEEVTDSQLVSAGWVAGQREPIRLPLPSGVVIEGQLVDLLRKKKGQIVLLTFDRCTVKRGTEFLFRPEWGKFDVVCGKSVTSVFGGAADRKSYLAATGGFRQDPGKQKSNLTEANKELNSLYAHVREFRESSHGKSANPELLAQLKFVYQLLESEYSNDWLLRYELLELVVGGKINEPWEGSLRKRLAEIGKKWPEQGEIIQRGLDVLRG